ncbi:MAG: protein kinase [Deltaproteobacteria bacterium]|nr:protein kinase [Deltaproteobacteria bacterium]
MDPQQGPPQQDFIIGQTIGNYLVTQKLGEGGMGAVYLAEHPSIGKKVALKVLHAEFSSNEDVVQRFFNEAKAVNNIGHPNIVDITDYGIIQLGVGKEHLVYFIMEYLGGTTLSKLVRTESPLSPERTLGIAMQVGDALAASHRCGIVHRDLKPDNIMLTQRGRERDFVKLLDFGIAKLTGGAAGSRQTRTGIVMGTPAYMSPEQCDGRGHIDHRTDVYALGIVIYEMMVGRVPFLGEGYGEVLVQHLTQQPIPPSQFRLMNPHIEAVIMKALEKRVELRYPTMDEMIRALSDPVSFVEQHGGIATFNQVQLMPSTAPMPEIRMTPPPLAVPSMPTPSPGTLSPVPYGAAPHTPTPGMGVHAAPTIGGVTTQEPQKNRKTGLIIGGLVVAAIAIVAIVMATRGKSNDTPIVTAPSGSDTAGTGSAGSSVAAGTGSARTGSGEQPVGSGSAIGSGSNVASEPGSGSGPGSATVEKTASLTITTRPPNATILINGQPLSQKTGQEFTVQRGAPVTVTLHLDSKHEDITFIIEKPEGKILLEKNFVKKKVVFRPGQGSAGKGSGSATPGRGSARGSNDTGLIRPGD